jgi:hypothetical protein
MHARESRASFHTRALRCGGPSVNYNESLLKNSLHGPVIWTVVHIVAPRNQLLSSAIMDPTIPLLAIY